MKSSRDPAGDVLDAVVVGSGFGGLGAALSLAERGARVVLCEALNYPGGCASTFSRDGYRFEAGATLFSGFAEGQLFERWIAAHGLEVPLDWLEPVVELRAPLGAEAVGTLAIDRHPGGLERALAALPGAPVQALGRFFALQRRVADALWEVLEDESLLPPLGPTALARHALRLPRYAPLARLVGRPLASVLARFGLADWQPLRLTLDALCQITVQCGVDEAEAPMALSVMDYYSRGPLTSAEGSARWRRRWPARSSERGARCASARGCAARDVRGPCGRSRRARARSVHARCS